MPLKSFWRQSRGRLVFESDTLLFVNDTDLKEITSGHVKKILRIIRKYLALRSFAPMMINQRKI
jgi:hypothetical protein